MWRKELHQTNVLQVSTICHFGETVCPAPKWIREKLTNQNSQPIVPPWNWDYTLLRCWHLEGSVPPGQRGFDGHFHPQEVAHINWNARQSQWRFRGFSTSNGSYYWYKAAEHLWPVLSDYGKYEADRVCDCITCKVLATHFSPPENKV